MSGFILNPYSLGGRNGATPIIAATQAGFFGAAASYAVTLPAGFLAVLVAALVGAAASLVGRCFITSESLLAQLLFANG